MTSTSSDQNVQWMMDLFLILLVRVHRLLPVEILYILHMFALSSWVDEINIIPTITAVNRRGRKGNHRFFLQCRYFRTCDEISENVRSIMRRIYILIILYAFGYRSQIIEMVYRS